MTGDLEPYSDDSTGPKRGVLSGIARMLREDSRRLFRAGVPHFFAALLSTQGMSMIRRILLARILSVPELGQMTYVMRIVDLLAILADLGICTAVLKYVAEPVSDEKRQNLYVAGLFWGAVVSVTVGLLYMVPILFFVQQDRAVQIFMLMITPYIPLAALAKIPILFMQARKEIKRAARYMIITQVISLVVVVGATYYFRLWGFFSTVVVAPVSNIVLLLFVTREHLHWVRPTLGAFKKLVSFGFFSMLANATGFANAAAAVILLKHLTGSDTLVGLYGVALTVAMGVRLLPRALMQVSFPYLSGLLEAPYRLRRRMLELSIKQGAVVLGLAVLWFFLGRYAIILVFGSKYSGSFVCSAVLVLGLIPFAVGGPCGQTLLALGRVRLTFIFSLLGFFANVGSAVLLIPSWEILGAAGGAVIGQVTAFSGSTAAAIIILSRAGAKALTTGTPRKEQTGHKVSRGL